MSTLRRIALWLAVNVPLGPLSPYLLGFGLNSKPKPHDRETTVKSKLDALAAILYITALICGVIYGFSMVRDRQGNVAPADWVR